ncbi:MAG: hypothetical protein PHW12_10195 [Smithella sp.]|nr:hypothetical protein [Smithella sp.]
MPATGKGDAGKEEFPDNREHGIKKSQFAYDAEVDCFVCPVGHALELKSSAGDGKKIYQAQSGEFSLICAAHNIKKIVHAIKQKVVSLKQGRLIPQAVY